MTATKKPLSTRDASPLNLSAGKNYPVDHPRQNWWSDNTIVVIQGIVVAVEMIVVLILLNSYFTARAAMVHAHTQLPPTPSTLPIVLPLFGVAIAVPLLTLLKRGMELAWWHLRH